MTQDVIIIGAPRSGTNMLRDVLTSLTGFATWPCDEINLIWRHGNRQETSDELTAAMARPEVCHYLHRQFSMIGEKYRAETVVEKTCANSLRVEFVAQAFPNAKYIFIHRDGIDAAASTMRRWNAEFDLRYTLAKAKYAPLSDLPFYAVQMAKRRWGVRNDRHVSVDDQRVASWWGPKPRDFRQLQQKHSLDELSMIQWRRCVEASLRGVGQLPDEQVMHVAYEQFVDSPETDLRRILRFLGRADSFDEQAIAHVSGKSVGQGRSSLATEVVQRLTDLGGNTLEKLGYV